MTVGARKLIEPWSPYDGRQDLASVGRVSLVKAFADVVRVRLGTEPYELSSVFAAPSDDAENDCEKDLVALQSRYFIDDFLSGAMMSFARPIGGGEAVPMPASMWELDDCLLRFATGAFNLERWVDTDTEPTHYIFVDRQQFEKLLMSLPTDDTLSDYQMQYLADPRHAIRQREQSKQTPGAPLPIIDSPDLPHSHVSSQDRLLGLASVMEVCGYKKSKIYDMVQKGQFPKQTGDGGKALWSAHEIYQWVEQRKDKRR
jgi:predicted DNA-binding transcriptional regulator AlpA